LEIKKSPPKHFVKKGGKGRVGEKRVGKRKLTALQDRGKGGTGIILWGKGGRLWGRSAGKTHLVEGKNTEKQVKRNQQNERGRGEDPVYIWGGKVCGET